MRGPEWVRPMVFPEGLAEPDPGLDVNVAVLAAGAVVTVALLVARVAWPAWRLASAGHGGREAAGGVSRRPLLAGWAARAGATVTAAVGVRLALEPGRGRTAVPVRGALAGTALSIAAVAAAFTFGANLVHLVGTPRLYGKTWDVAVDFQFSTVTPQVAGRFLGRVPGVTGWTFGDFGAVGIGGNLVPAIGVAGGRGPLMSVTILAGHPPSGPGQVVLGSSVLRRLGLRVGQRGRDRPRGGESRLQLHAGPVRARPTPRRGHRRLRAVHGCHLRTGRAAPVRGARSASQRRCQLCPH